MFSKKRKSSSSSQQQRLFSTLASIEQTDERATQKRKQSHQSSLTQSKAANDQVKLNGILLELRILMQRCLDAGEDDVVLSSSSVEEEVQVEMDSLMENLLVARRELLGHEMEENGGGGKDDEGDDSDSSDDVDYAQLIQQENGTKNDESSSSGSEEDDHESDIDNTLPAQLQNEYESLRKSWKTILNKHHSNLALHSGMSVNSSKFQSKAVDLSFWDQVKFATSQSSTTVDTNKKSKKDFDDSKLYQQMLKDFISQSSSSGGGSSATGGKRVDPAQEAAERLKRAMRKKNGVDGDVELSTLLLTKEGGASNLPNSINGGGAAAASRKANVDRRASKGRKIRYTVHPKLVNFTFPVARPEPMIKEDIWFKSLFGGVGRV